ncbi:hypothetical protein MPRF_10870 [Mycolicibacterium parafortuitum]|uniref:Uncharacterized protein n=1 Tax=Mycolicibacterium parafortuitum TaxID=39692 RepID=A0A7I7TYI3_MYCPF|nr:hypothetical protein [Mycolicibacterium parafortuitum]BBY74188.1 hypothetical protein MPRF_10870 [Mycolicibacterium parafortuitum]
MPIFTDVLTEYAERTQRRAVAAAAERVRAPLTVEVRGRPGTGRHAVAAALAAAGLPVVADSARADVRVVVVAEAVKPEDRALLATDGPALVVLNKADLAGRVPGGPPAEADRTAARLAAALGRPVVPMVALLAGADIDDELFAALRALAATPADLSSVDAFVTGEHPVPAQVRQRLLTRLDRYGTARAVLAVADGATPVDVEAALRTLSRSGEVVAALAGFAPEVGYRRVCAVVTELTREAIETRDDELGAFLVSDAVVVAVMAAAVDHLESCGLRIDRGDDPDAHLRRALRWRRYADGPLAALYRRGAADVSRGSLRLLARSR